MLTSLLLIVLDPKLLHLLGMVITFVVVAYITSEKTIPDRYIPRTNHDFRNAYRKPLLPPSWWRGNSGMRGIAGAIIFAGTFPIYGYHLRESNPQLWALLWLFALSAFVLGLIVPNTIRYVSPAGAFWGLVAAGTGWIGSFFLERSANYIAVPGLHGYHETPWNWVVVWIFAAFVFGTGNVFVWALLLRWFSIINESWFVRLVKAGDGVVVGYAGHFVRIISNLPNYMITAGVDHHHPHIPLPLVIDPTDRELVYDWIQYGAHALHDRHITLRAANGQPVDLHHWHTHWRQRVSQAVGFIPDSRAWHVLPTVACIGVPMLSELLPLPSRGHGAHGGGHGTAHSGGHDSHGAAPQVNYRFSWDKRTDNFRTQPVANRAGTSWVVKLGYQAFLVFPERQLNTNDPHAAVHQWWDHIGGFLATKGDKLMGRLGGIEELEVALEKVSDEWLVPDMDAVGPLTGVLHMLEHVQMAILADTGEAVINVAVEDVDLPAEIRDLLHLALKIHFQTDPKLRTRRVDALRQYVEAEMGGVLTAMRTAGVQDEDIGKAAVAAADKYFLRGVDMVLWGNVGSNAGLVAPTGKKGGTP